MSDVLGRGWGAYEAQKEDTGKSTLWIVTHSRV